MKALGGALAAGPLIGVLGLAVIAGASGAATVSPTGQAPVSTTAASTSTGSCLLSDEDSRFRARLTSTQVSNAATIVTVGHQLSVPRFGEIIALATAFQESGLVNLNYGDRDSLGLFQQRPSQGWGTPDEVLDPVYAATQFYSRLVEVPGWQQLPLTVAAQAVQRSAFPDAYARWQVEADVLDAGLDHQPGVSLTC